MILLLYAPILCKYQVIHSAMLAVETVDLWWVTLHLLWVKNGCSDLSCIHCWLLNFCQQFVGKCVWLPHQWLSLGPKWMNIFPPILVELKLKKWNELSNCDQNSNVEFRIIRQPTMTSKILLMFGVALLTFRVNQTFPSSRSFPKVFNLYNLV